MKKFLWVLAVLFLTAGCGQKQDQYVQKESCEVCMEFVDRWIPTVYEGEICASCFCKSEYSVCRGCNLAYDISEFDCVDGYCTGCAEKNAWGCSICESLYGIDHLVDLGDGYYICPECAKQFLSDETNAVKKNSPFVSRMEIFPQS